MRGWRLAVSLVFLAAACGSSSSPAPTSSPTATAATPPPVAAAQPTARPATALPALSAFQKGMAFGDWRSFGHPRPGLYLASYTDQSLKDVAATGANWISLVAGCGQETIASTEIFCRPPRTATDAELGRVVRLAHDLGMRVMLKPQIDPVSSETDPTQWRGLIGRAFTTEEQWQAWFATYTASIRHFAAFSQQAAVDMLCIGVELGGTTHREQEWRHVIEEVRAVFKGPITYASLSSSGAPPPHGEERRMVWWDAVDFIGIDAYYPLATSTTPTVAQLKEAWPARGYLGMLEDLSRRFNRQIIFTEFGYRSIDGAARCPGCWQKSGTIDLQEQADLYQAALEVLWGRSWLAGVYWWQWLAVPGESGANNTDFTPFRKPAEQVLRSFYARTP